jgi:uncharacterized BrkB/YihY/UPF0761 family membrane protein
MAFNMSACYLIVVVIAALLGVFGLWNILKKDHKDENQINGVQRQIRGFGILIVAQLVLLIGISLCFGYGTGGDKLRQIATSYGLV